MPVSNHLTHLAAMLGAQRSIDQQDFQGVRYDRLITVGYAVTEINTDYAPGSMTRRSHGPQRQHVGAEFVH